MKLARRARTGCERATNQFFVLCSTLRAVSFDFDLAFTFLTGVALTGLRALECFLFDIGIFSRI